MLKVRILCNDILIIKHAKYNKSKWNILLINLLIVIAAHLFVYNYITN